MVGPELLRERGHAASGDDRAVGGRVLATHEDLGAARLGRGDGLGAAGASPTRSRSPRIRRLRARSRPSSPTRREGARSGTPTVAGRRRTPATVQFNDWPVLLDRFAQLAEAQPSRYPSSNRFEARMSSCTRTGASRATAPFHGSARARPRSLSRRRRLSRASGARRTCGRRARPPSSGAPATPSPDGSGRRSSAPASSK